MTRNFTAQLKHVTLGERLSMAFGLRRASMDPKANAARQAVCRLAAKHLLGSVLSTDYDILIRLQVLEGISRTTSPGSYAGTWWKKGRRGLADAKATLIDDQGHTDIDPSWFSTGHTGMMKKCYAIVEQMMKGAQKSGVTTSTEDILQNAVMGFTKDGMGALKGGPIFFQVGYYNKNIQGAIFSGRQTPVQVAGNGAKLIKLKVLDELTQDVKTRGKNITDEGTSVFDMVSKDPASIYDILADDLADPTSKASRLLQKGLEKRLGKGKWADIAAEILGHQMSGKRIVKQEMAARYEMAPGTLSKVIRTRIKPAQDALMKDQRFLDQLRDIAEMSQPRRASIGRLVKRSMAASISAQSASNPAS